MPATITLTGSVIVYCGHGEGKRQVKDLLFDVHKTKAHLCPCCENLYLKDSDIPGMCPKCSTWLGVRSNG